MKGNLIIISSPSGGGKGTLIKEILKSVQNIGYSVSYTTRPKREGEEDGRHYYFVTREKFEKLIAAGEFLEYATVHGNYYGTSIKQVEGETALGRDVILEIDVQGAENVRRILPEAVSIFILPPSFEVLKARLTARATEKEEDLNLRLRNSYQEVKNFGEFEFIIVNDSVERASTDLARIILAERLRRVRQMDTIRAILSSFDISNIENIGE